ncbi:MAG: bifunctional acetate--CoA ligase family protein/GNAT family N-acetyltransferase [Gammaproteobacteria bacterium]|nr:bifunctional acetate--CoA ligase family protein/GNAT family N-acetyltransferase [Gammaproteobacteria bacterium]
MGSHYLKKLFEPASIAVIGATDRPHSVGMKVFKNLLQGNFGGKLYAINPKHTQVQGQPCFASVKKISQPIDLAVITTPAKKIASIIRECGEKGISAAIVISAGFSETGKEGKKLEQAVLEAAHRYQIRLIGPNCLGVMRPHIKMNATFDNNFALEGNLALVSQSGALCAGILDWAIEKKIGFSAMISLGNSADIDFGDVLDYLALDQKTKSILLYIEGIRNSRRFMSGLRACARMKPIVAIKAGRLSQGSRAALSHTGALIGDDDVFDVALRRAGVVRVMTIEELFSAAEILSSNCRTKGNRLCIITNGGGAGVMAADRASELNIMLPKLDETLMQQLDEVLPTQWSHQNPVDIIGDATPERYHASVNICSKEKNIDGFLTILVPVAMSQPKKVAEQVILDAKGIDKPLIACWIGEKQVKSSWKLFASNKIPYFDTPEKAVAAFSYLVDYHHNQQLLLQVPDPLSPQPKPDVAKARFIIETVLEQQRQILTGIESKAVLKAFGIPVSQTIDASTPEKALAAAESLGFPVAMKIHSPDITHKQDVGGVALNIIDAKSVVSTFEELVTNAKKLSPSANILGVTVESMFKGSNTRELMVGVIRDKVFGPVISFGAGGTFVEIMDDKALALPPLNKFITKSLISQTRVARLLGAYRNMPAVNLDTIINILLRVSEMVCELPYIQEMDINPVIINEQEAIAVDARIVINKQPPSSIPYAHMAIHPYPHHLISSYQLSDDTKIIIRPICPEDAKIAEEFIINLSPQSKHFRFMEQMRELTPSMLVRLTQIDYDREMALVATVEQNRREMNIGIIHYVINPDLKTCEFGLVIADAWQKKGIGSKLMNSLMDIAKVRGITAMIGVVYAENVAMLELAHYLGFSISSSDDSTLKIVTKLL